MPIQPPEPSGSYSYGAEFQSIDTVGEYRLQIDCTAFTDNLNLPEVAPIFQKFVDWASQCPDFTFTFAERTQTYAEQITPTAAPTP